MYEVANHGEIQFPNVKKNAGVSTDSVDENPQGNTGDGNATGNVGPIKSSSRFIEFYESALDFRDRVTLKLRCRLKYFGVVFVILTLVIFGQGGTSVKLNGVGPSGWYSFFAVVLVTHVCSTLADELFFWILNALWRGPAEFLLYADCLNGPLSFMITLSVINTAFYDMDVREVTDYWGLLVTTMITVWTFFTIRKFYQRKGFNRMLEARYSEKLVDMEMDSNILSLLASYVPPPPSQAPTRYASYEDATLPGPITPHRSLRNDSTRSEGTTNTSDSGTAPLNRKQRALNVLRAARFGARFKRMTQKYMEEKEDLHNIFSEIVEASAAVDDEAPGVDLPLASAPRKVAGENDTEQASTFWDRLHRVSQGMLRIHTLNGLLVIRRKQYVRSFSKRLYMLLSSSGRRKLTGKRLSQLLNATLDRIEAKNSGNADGRSSSLFNQGKDDGEIVHFVREADRETIVKRMLKLFHVDMDSGVFLTQDNVHNICVEVFLAHKNIASSLNDFGELNRSITSVMDVVFWIGMVLIAQYTLRIDTTDLFAPLLTIVFGLSFAVGPMIGNICLSIGYVLFVLPYDVGDRVAVGYGSSKIIGNVVGITLLHTTMKTMFNERVGPFNIHSVSLCVPHIYIHTHIYVCAYLSVNLCRYYISHLLIIWHTAAAAPSRPVF